MTDAERVRRFLASGGAEIVGDPASLARLLLRRLTLPRADGRPETLADLPRPLWMDDPTWTPYLADGTLSIRGRHIADGARRPFAEVCREERIRSEASRRWAYETWSWFAAARLIRQYPGQWPPPAIP